jgi:RNA-directed DNA polymerase
MSRIGSEHSMPDGDADHPAVMPGQPGKAGGGTADGPGHAHQTGAVCNDTAEDLPSMTMEEVLRRENMLSAFQRVVGNAGAPGIDGMTVADLGPALIDRWQTIRSELLDDRYAPQPVRKVEIPKPGGTGVRMLGIPTVIDRLIQQAVLQILQPHFDATFSDASFGFRPGRSAHQAIERAREHIAAGSRWVVDMDLEKFFDRVNHDVLMSRLAKRIEDKRILHLIRRYLTAGMMEDGLVSQRTQGTPQGGPLSPLLSNVLLDELDRELERRGHRFVRYADDCNVYVRSQAAGERVLASVERYLKDALRLTVNRAKSAVARPWNRKFLGYTVTTHHQPKLKVAPESAKRLMDTLRSVFRRGRGTSLGSAIREIAPMLRGWLAYYRKADVRVTFEELDQWIRRKLRCILWRQWKRPKTRFTELTRRGIEPGKARISAGNGHGPWWNAGAGHMNQAVPTRFLHQLGLVSLLQEHRRLERSS